jgi:hypothetical protein
LSSLTLREETADRLNITANIDHAFHSVDAEKVDEFVTMLGQQLLEIGTNLHDTPIIGM